MGPSPTHPNSRLREECHTLWRPPSPFPCVGCRQLRSRTPVGASAPGHVRTRPNCQHRSIPDEFSFDPSYLLPTCLAVSQQLQVQEADHPQEIERTEEKGGKLPVDLVKLAKIAISPVLGKGLAEFEVAFTNP